MNKKIGHITFGKDDFGYGLSYILNKNNIHSKRASFKTAKHFDILLFSCFWWAHVYDFWGFCVKAGVGNKKKKPEIIVGGFNTFNPWVFLPMAHKVCVGDGENVVLDAIHDRHNESIFTGAEKSVVYANADISQNTYAYRHGDISRVEIARGCKYKCKFCQLTHLKKYREVDLESVKAALDNVETKRVAIFAPNGMTHKNYHEISDYAKAIGLSNVATDVRYNEIKEYENNNTPTMGIEGISYKLRKTIRKPLSNEKFLDVLKTRAQQCYDRGYKPSIHTYFILDLPGEDKGDWIEFENLLQEVNMLDFANNLTWIMTGNVFMPAPHTPLDNKTINLDRDYKNIWRDAISDLKREKPFNFTIAGRHSIFSPYSRLLSMIATRGGPESWEIIYNIINNKELKHNSVGRWQKSLHVLERFLTANFDGPEVYTGSPKEKPWKVVKFKSE